MQEKILIVEDDPVTTKLVETLLFRNKYLVATAKNGVEGIQIAKTYHPDLIIMDVMMPEMDGYEASERIRKDPEIGHVPIIMLTALADIEQKIKGFEAGADDYLAKPFDPKEFLSRVEAHLRRMKRMEAVQKTTTIEGRTIAVFSLRGGSGVSSIAANVACALPNLWKTETVLVDLNLVVGQSALYLNTPIKHTLEDLAHVPVEEIDLSLVNNVLVQSEFGVKLLAAPLRPETSELFTAEKIRHILQLLRSNYHYVILDLPHNFYPTTLAGMDLAEEILLVLTPEIAGVRSSMIALKTLIDLGYSKDSIHPIVNWVFESNGISQEKIEIVLRTKVDLTIPYAGEHMLLALNYGTPSVVRDPESPLAAIFEDLAFVISKPEHNRKVPEMKTKAWKRVARRIKNRKK